MHWFSLLWALSDVTAAPQSQGGNTASQGTYTPHAYGSPAAVPPPYPPPTSPASEPSRSSARDFVEHPVTIELRMGFGTPTGVLGLAIGYAPLPAFGFECGAGTNTLGLQLECALRGRLLLAAGDRWLGEGVARALTLSSGVSGGRYVDDHFFEKITAVDGPGPAQRHWERAYWWNTDIGMEWRYGSFVMRSYAGLALLLNPNANTIVKPESESTVESVSTVLFYLGVGLGGAP